LVQAAAELRLGSDDSPSRDSFRPPSQQTVRFRVGLIRRASTYRQPVLGAFARYDTSSPPTSGEFGGDAVGAATATSGGSMVYPRADRPSTKWGRRRDNLSIDPRKSVSCPLGVTGVRADPPVVAPDLPVSISPVGAIRRSRRSVLRKSLELASYLRIEERELEAGGLN